MSTRSDIIVERGDGTWKRVYCHFDGYLEGVGATLFAHYNSQERAEALVEPGDMSILAAKCTKPAGHSYETPVVGYTVYYGRDRGESEAIGTVAPDLEGAWPKKDSWTEYTYVWKFQHGWFVGAADDGPPSLVRLEAALSGEDPEPDVKSPFGVLWSRK